MSDHRPALIALAHGSRDPRSSQTIATLVREARRQRPGLRIEAAFLDLAEPSFGDVVDLLVAAGHAKIVVVPLLLTQAYHARVDVPAAITVAQARHPHAWLRATSVLGLGPWLRPVLDHRLTQALAERPVGALVVAAAGSSNPAANLAVTELARNWAAPYQVPVEVAFASATAPSTSEAVRSLRRLGYDRVAVASLFLAPGVLPDRAAELALEAGALAVAEPLGPHPDVAAAILARYNSPAALELTY